MNLTWLRSNCSTVRKPYPAARNSSMQNNVPADGVALSEKTGGLVW